MAAVQVFLLPAFFLVLAQATSTNPLSGSFNTKDGSRCNWFDMLSGTENDVHFTVPCVCKNAAGVSQGYVCRYTGALRACRAHDENRRAVYDDLVNQLTALDNACGPDSLASALCSGVEMKRETIQALSSPCVSTDHREL